jgi:predicted ATPase
LLLQRQNPTTTTTTTTTTPRGVYLHGGVGCGKTFCMNLFFREAPMESKQMVHFHSFMLSVHQDMHDAKKTNKKDGGGAAILDHVVSNIKQRGQLICFDEFQVTDVADAMLLQRLFTSLIDDHGCIIVATSNRPPTDLYLGGLQRDRFLPFIQLLESKCDVVDMWDSETDYRLVQGNRAMNVYFVVGTTTDNNNNNNMTALELYNATFHAMTQGSTVKSTHLTTQGRLVYIPRAALARGICRFTFQDLCQKALGAADYLVIGHTFHTVFVEDIPKLGIHEINWVRRFIVFVDAMYESHVKLVVLAEGQPEELFTVDLENKDHDEVFAFDRTRSRLEEMRSTAYLTKRWRNQQQPTTTNMCVTSE